MWCSCQWPCPAKRWASQRLQTDSEYCCEHLTLPGLGTSIRAIFINVRHSWAGVWDALFREMACPSLFPELALASGDWPGDGSCSEMVGCGEGYEAGKGCRGSRLGYHLTEGRPIP